MKTVLEMAIKAEILSADFDNQIVEVEDLERFAALVREDERKSNILYRQGFSDAKRLLAEREKQQEPVTFDEWWNADILTSNNPYEPDSAAYWAWEGWQAAVLAEREKCAKMCEDFVPNSNPAFDPIEEQIAAAIRARGE